MKSRVVESPIRSLAADGARVADLLDFLPVLYPGGEQWLVGALADVKSGEGDGWIVEENGNLVAILLGRLKPSGRYKIRTLFVAPEYRGHGHGRRLLRTALDAAEGARATHAYVTVASTVDSLIAPLLHSEGFEPIALERSRYGTYRDEIVYQRTL